MTVVLKIYKKEMGRVITNHVLSLREVILLTMGYDIENADDCEKATKNNVPGFYQDNSFFGGGTYTFDTESATTEIM